MVTETSSPPLLDMKLRHPSDIDAWQPLVSGLISFEIFTGRGIMRWEPRTFEITRQPDNSWRVDGAQIFVGGARLPALYLTWDRFVQWFVTLQIRNIEIVIQ